MFGFKKPEKSAEKKDDKSLVDSAQNGSNVKGSPSQTFQLRQMANQDKAYVSNNAYANFTKELKSLSEKHKHLGEYLVNFNYLFRLFFHIFMSYLLSQMLRCHIQVIFICLAKLKILKFES